MMYSVSEGFKKRKIIRSLENRKNIVNQYDFVLDTKNR